MNVQLFTRDFKLINYSTDMCSPFMGVIKGV